MMKKLVIAIRSRQQKLTAAEAHHPGPVPLPHGCCSGA